MTKDVRQLAEERLARLETAINLQEPDRVPVWGIAGDIVPKYSGITQYEMYYESEKTVKAVAKFIKDFPFDMSMASLAALDGRVLAVAFAKHMDISPAIAFITGPIHDILGDKYTKFPGREIDENVTPQFIGGTFMEPEEYDALIEDPIKFISETVLPRACKNLETPDQAKATWVRMGMELANAAKTQGEIARISAELGYPNFPMGWGYAPLDIIGDFLRGVANVVLDLRRYPDKVKKATEALLPPLMDYALSNKDTGAKYAFFPLHLNEYLSPKLYKEFYWPTLKAIILRLYEEGIKSIVFFEGRHDAHLETILELPKGWGVAYFEKTDVVKAKKLLQGHTCIMGGIPMGLVNGGTPAEIDEYIKNLIEQMKPGGGFILAPGVNVAPADTPLENIRAVIEAVEKYG
jgi:uroporphyrinogen-III decarboxylase